MQLYIAAYYLFLLCLCSTKDKNNIYIIFKIKIIYFINYIIVYLLNLTYPAENSFNVSSFIVNVPILKIHIFPKTQ